LSLITAREFSWPPLRAVALRQTLVDWVGSLARRAAVFLAAILIPLKESYWLRPLPMHIIAWCLPSKTIRHSRLRMGRERVERWAFRVAQHLRPKLWKRRH